MKFTFRFDSINTYEFIVEADNAEQAEERGADMLFYQDGHDYETPEHLVNGRISDWFTVEPVTEGE